MFRERSLLQIIIDQSGAVTDKSVIYPYGNLVPVAANEALKGLGIGRNRKERQARIAAMARDAKHRG